MTNATVVLSRSWASAHPNWAAACEDRYDYLHRAAGTLGFAHGAEGVQAAEITQIEAQQVEIVQGREVMVWRTHLHIPGVTVTYAADVLDDMPGDRSAPSVRVGESRPTPAPPTPDTSRPVGGTPL